MCVLRMTSGRCMQNAKVQTLCYQAWWGKHAAEDQWWQAICILQFYVFQAPVQGQVTLLYLVMFNYEQPPHNYNNIMCYTRFIVYKGKVWTWMLLFVLIGSASVKTWHGPNTTNICSSRGMLHIDRKTFLNLLGWPGIKGKHSTCVLVWLHRSFALLGRWMILEAIQRPHGVMVWNKTVLRDLEICPQWGLVWLCEWCNSCPRVTTTQDRRKVWVFCF